MMAKEGAIGAIGGLKGRQDALQTLNALARDQALVTVAGPVGIGKSALVRAWRPRGAVLVPLADIEDPLAAIARVLEVRDVGKIDNALASVCPLLVLDDADCGVEVLRSRLPDWLASGVRAVVTVRSRLHLPEEAVLDLGPLAPDAASELFVALAARHRPQQSFDPDAVRAIVTQLDGIPLALELAAARIRLFEPAELAQRLSVDLLRDGAREGRHASLRQAIDDTIAALSAGAAKSLAVAAAFASGFDRDAFVHAVDDGDALDWLGELLDAGLVQEVPSEGLPYRRLRLLRPVREVARGRAPEEGVLDRLCAFVAARARGLVVDLPGVNGRETLSRLVADAGNLEMALRHGGLCAADATIALCALDATQGPLTSGAARLSAVGDLETLPESLRADVLFAVGCATLAEQRVADAVAHLMAAAGLATSEAQRVRMLPELGQALTLAGQPEQAVGVLEEAIALAIRVGDPLAQGMARTFRARLWVERDAAKAREEATEAVGLLQAWPEHLTGALQTLSLAQHACGEGPAARASTLALAADLPHGARSRLSLERQVAIALADAGDLEGAVHMHQRLLERAMDIGDRGFELGIRLNLVPMLLEQNDLAGATEQLHRSAPLFRGPFTATQFRVRQAQVKFATGDDAGALAGFQAGIVDFDREGAAGPKRALTLWVAALTGQVCGTGLEVELLTAAREGHLPEDLVNRVASSGRQGLRLLVALLLRRRPRVVVARDGRWFDVPGEGRVDLSTRVVLARFVAALAGADRPLSQDALLAAAWPGERPKGNSGRARVHVTVSTLRKLGLKEALVTLETAEGTSYRLDAEVA